MGANLTRLLKPYIAMKPLELVSLTASASLFYAGSWLFQKCAEGCTLPNGDKANLFLQYVKDYGGIFGGPIESLQTIFIIGVSILCFFRFFQLKKRPWLFKCPLLMMAFLSLFLFLEEISYGQRIFDYEIPDFFQKYNHQKETNLHNLYTFNLDSSGVKFNTEDEMINHIFKRWIKHLIVPLYLVLFPMMFYLARRYRSSNSSKFSKIILSSYRFTNSLAIPIPRLIHFIVYVIFQANIRTQIWYDEGNELILTLVFFMIFFYPLNKSIFEDQ